MSAGIWASANVTVIAGAATVRLRQGQARCSIRSMDAARKTLVLRARVTEPFRLRQLVRPRPHAPVPVHNASDATMEVHLFGDLGVRPVPAAAWSLWRPGIGGAELG